MVATIVNCFELQDYTVSGIRQQRVLSFGKGVIIEGVAYHDTTTVADLQHYAEDAGKSKEEIAAITKPEKEVRVTAKGIVIVE